MPFDVLIKQRPDAEHPNHFSYETQVAFNTELNSAIRNASMHYWLNHLKPTYPADTFLRFTLENVEQVMDETVIGRVVTTRQLLAILNTDEFVEQPADCSLLLGGITVTHLLIMQNNFLYDTGLDDIELEWLPNDFDRHYRDNLWRIND